MPEVIKGRMVRVCALCTTSLSPPPGRRRPRSSGCGAGGSEWRGNTRLPRRSGIPTRCRSL
eukprot:7512141-Alexandrium_andersonii.AAC.1